MVYVLVACLLFFGFAAPAAFAAPVSITTATDLQASITANAPGTVFLLQAGTHRRGNLVPKDGNVFLGAPGAILSGGVVLTGWTAAGSDWYVSGQTQGIARTSVNCLTGFEACYNREDVFYDDVPLQGVTSLAALGPGQFFFDYAADRIYIRDIPTGHTVETSVLAAAFTGSAQNVTVRGLQIEKYATPIQDGAFELSTTAHGWTIEQCVIRHNHSYGIHLTGSGWTIRGNTVSTNGQLGIGGVTKNTLIEGNLVTDNNYARVNPGFEAGGIKLAIARAVRVVRNQVATNHGNGIWCDVSCVDVLYEGNVVTSNASSGLSYEISYHAVIRHNTSQGNGTVYHGYITGSQLGISASERVQAYGNVFQIPATGGAGVRIAQQNRGVGLWGEYTARGNRVHHNTFRYAAGTTFAPGHAGTEDDYLFKVEEQDNRWDYNLAFVTAAAPVWIWNGCIAGASYASFQACGLDVHGARYDP